MDRIEAVGWMGIVPLILLVRSLAHRGTDRRPPELRDILGPPPVSADHGPAEAGPTSVEPPERAALWRTWSAAGFAIWALGPILTVGGFDTGLKLPAILLRYVPFVANARMPGRAIVGLFMALAVLAGVELRLGRRWWRHTAGAAADDRARRLRLLGRRRSPYARSIGRRPTSCSRPRRRAPSARCRSGSAMA
jgi:hypothetical protein